MLAVAAYINDRRVPGFWLGVIQWLSADGGCVLWLQADSKDGLCFQRAKDESEFVFSWKHVAVVPLECSKVMEDLVVLSQPLEAQLRSHMEGRRLTAQSPPRTPPCSYGDFSAHRRSSPHKTFQNGLISEYGGEHLDERARHALVLDSVSLGTCRAVGARETWVAQWDPRVAEFMNRRRRTVTKDSDIHVYPTSMAKLIEVCPWRLAGKTLDVFVGDYTCTLEKSKPDVEALVRDHHLSDTVVLSVTACTRNSKRFKCFRSVALGIRSVFHAGTTHRMRFTQGYKYGNMVFVICVLVRR